ADRSVEVRHADDEPGALRAVPQEDDLPRRGDRSLERDRRIAHDDPQRGWQRRCAAARSTTPPVGAPTMAKFQWEATSRSGERKKGAMEADSAEIVESRLRSDGMT